MAMRLFCQFIAVFKNLQLENSDPPPPFFLFFIFEGVQSLMLPTKRKKEKEKCCYTESLSSFPYFEIYDNV